MYSFDDRRNIIVIPTKDEAVQFAANDWIANAKSAISRHGAFYVALSGGSTPTAIFKNLAERHSTDIDWTKVFLFWSDERSVPPEHKDNNYRSAMEAGLIALPIPTQHIFRMHAEDGQEADKPYEELIRKTVPNAAFDLIMLGMGDDGHTASLFPHTEALKISDHLVVMNHVPQKSTWRMTFTYPLIHKAHYIVIYVLGSGKEEMVKKIFKGPFQPMEYPIQKVGTSSNKALWILDAAAAANLALPESACLS
ncbi:MAG: 6-phosphogluconolactonase [Parachlamydiales bacterium]|jgi:6-phosphogluconolactonase